MSNEFKDSDRPSARELEDLRIARATEGLDSSALEELARLERESTDHTGDPTDFDRAATAIEYAMEIDAMSAPVGSNVASEPFPEELDRRLASLASDYAARSVQRSKREAEAERFATKRTDRSRYLGWTLAAAASILAIVGWLPRLLNETTPEIASTPPDIVAALAGTEDPLGSGATGVAEWQSDGQTGFLRIRGLQANDPTLFQYQLWIFDATRDERYPVDGGVFDIPADAAAGGEIVVPINAKILVGEPTLFAITVEQPGGVVVSSRERIVLAGAVA